MVSHLLHSSSERPRTDPRFFIVYLVLFIRNPKSNSFSMDQIQACNREKVSNQDHRSCEKVGKNMASRKFNVLLYAFTGKAETLQSGSSGICE